MFNKLSFKKRNFLFFLISLLLFSQTEVNDVFAELKNEENQIKIDYLEKSDDNFYILGEGDTLGIVLVDTVEDLSEIEVSINPQGTIILPEIGRIYISGLTTIELENLLNKKFKNIIRNPNIQISVIYRKPIKISIKGEVKSPGKYSFQYGQTLLDIPTEESSNTKLLDNPTLFDAIQKAGGISPYSDLTRIEVIRENSLSNGGGEIKTTLNLLEVLSTGDKSQNIKLNNNDMIYVAKGEEKITFKIKEALKSNINPSTLNIYISGETTSPGPFELPRDSDLNTAVFIAGGKSFLRGNVILSRITSDGGYSNKVFRFNRKNKRGTKNNPYLKDGDIIYLSQHPIKALSELTGVITSPLVGIYSSYLIYKEIK